MYRLDIRELLESRRLSIDYLLSRDWYTSSARGPEKEGTGPRSSAIIYGEHCGEVRAATGYHEAHGGELFKEHQQQA